MLQVPPTHRATLEFCFQWEEFKVLLIDTSPPPKYPMDERVCNTETQCHLLPVQAEEVVSQQYLG